MQILRDVLKAELVKRLGHEVFILIGPILDDNGDSHFVFRISRHRLGNFNPTTIPGVEFLGKEECGGEGGSVFMRLTFDHSLFLEAMARGTQISTSPANLLIN